MIVRILRIPIDIILLTFHFTKGILWLLNYGIKSFLNFPQSDSFPYRCFSEKTKSGHNACLPGSKYANPLTFKLLCPDCKRIRQSNVETYCLTTLLTKHNYWRPALPRLFFVGVFLLGIWACIGFGLYQSVRLFLPAHVKHALRSKLFFILPDKDPGIVKAISSRDKQKSNEFFDKANALAKSKNYQEAILEYRNAIKYNPLNSEAYFALGSGLLMLNRDIEAMDAFKRCVQLDTKNWRAHKHLGVLYVAHGKNDKARDHANSILQIRDDLADAYLILGACNHESGEPRPAVVEAINKAKALLHSAPEEYETDTYIFGGNLCYVIKKFETAEYMYRTALELDSTLIDARIGLATLSSANKDFDQARTELDHILTNDPDNVKALACAAEINVQEGNIPKALASFERILELKPENNNIRIRQAQLLLATGNGNDAYKKLHHVLQQNPKNTKALIVLANLYMGKKLYAKAIECAQGVVDKNRQNVHANGVLIKAYLAQKDYDKAIDLIEEMKKIYPKNFDLTVMCALANQELGNVSSAIVLFREATEIKADSLAPYISLGGLYYQNNQLELAISSYEKALSLSPEHPTVSNNLAMLLLETDGGVERALKLAKQLKERYPENPYIDDTLGWAYYHHGDFDKAKKFLKLAIQKRPESAVAQYHLAKTFFKQKNFADAHKALTNAFNISKEFPDIDDARVLLTEIEKKLK